MGNRVLAVLAFTMPVALTAACTPGTSSDATAPMTPAAAPASPASASPATDATVGPGAGSPSPAASPATPSAEPSQAAPKAPQTLNLQVGQTAHLAYFDVTVLQTASGKDTVSYGWKVHVCYRRPHPGQNADGTTRVSKDPWSTQVRDGEGGGGYRWVSAGEFPADRGWTPEFRETRLRVGECTTGWIAVRHGSPDLMFGGVRYHTADFGDTITWT